MRNGHLAQRPSFAALFSGVVAVTLGACTPWELVNGVSARSRAGERVLVGMTFEVDVFKNCGYSQGKVPAACIRDPGEALTLVEAKSSDPSLLRVDGLVNSASDMRVRLTALAAGSADVNVTVDAAGTKVYATTTVTFVGGTRTIEHECTGGSRAAYVKGMPFVIPSTARTTDGAKLDVYAAPPGVRISPEQGLEFEPEASFIYLNFKAPEVTGEFVVSSTFGDASVEVRVVEASAIDGLGRSDSVERIGIVGEGIDRRWETVHLQVHPVAGTVPVCGFFSEFTATSLTTGICEVVGLAVSGLAAGTCRASFQFPGVAEPFIVELAVASPDE